MKAGAAFFLALILAVGATVGVFAYVNGVRQHNQRPAEQVAVIVSNVNIQPNTTLDPLISAGDFVALNVPTAAVVTGAVTDINQLRTQTTSQFIVAGEQIPTARLRGSEVQSGGPLNIPPGDQAVTIALEPQRLVNGLVQTGDHVVVYATLSNGSASSGGSGQVTVTVVPDVLVLKSTAPASSGVGSSNSEGTLLTLALSPSDSERVILAQEQGHLWLALLPPGQKGVGQRPLWMGRLVP